MDRVPEAKCLRTKIQQIVSQEFNRLLSRQWIESEGRAYFYIDGQVRIYHGSQANLTKKYVSRQKLCLAGTTEFWLNNEFGAPYLMVTGELNEKLKDVILEKLIPILLADTSDLFPEEQFETVAGKMFSRWSQENFFKYMLQDYAPDKLENQKTRSECWSRRSLKQMPI